MTDFAYNAGARPSPREMMGWVMRGEVALAIGGILQGCYERQLHPSLKPVGPDVLGRLLRLLFEGISGPHAPRERTRQ